METKDYKAILEQSKVREQAGYKAMATSVGKEGETSDVKKYMKADKFKKAIKGAKERAKKADDPEAYLASVERKILKGHFGKNEETEEPQPTDLKGILDQLNTELAEKKA